MVETTTDFILASLNSIFFILASLDLVFVLRIILLVFFFLYLYRILRDFSMFSEITCGVFAAGLTAILELTSGLFGFLANLFSGLFLFLGKNLGVIFTILVVLIVLLLGYFILSKIGWRFRKKARKARETKKYIKREAGKAFLEKVGETVTKK